MKGLARGVGIAILVGAGTGCLGLIGDGSGEGGVGDPPVESADALGTSDTRRLSDAELESTLRDLFGDEAIAAIDRALDLVPSDRVDTDFSSMQLGVSSIHVDAYYEVADALADHYAADTTRLGSIVPCFENVTFDQTCVHDFADTLGRRVYRRPVSDDERALLLELYDDGAEISAADGIRLMLLYMLQAPPFLYRLELAGPDVVGLPGVQALTSYEIATRLSYFAWGTTPDDELLDAAERGELLDPRAMEAHVERHFASTRAAAHVQRYFAEWLRIDQLPSIQQPDTFLDGLPAATLGQELEDEAARFIGYHVFEAESDLTALLTSDLAFITSPAVAQLCGVSAAPSLEEPVALDETRRGLLTRPAMLLGAGVETHPIQRGAHIRRRFLCDDIAPPDLSEFPPNTIVPPPFDPDMTARERWTEQTSAEQCASCHARINSYGFALERFDTLGRYRSTEPILDPGGTQVNELPIDDEVSVLMDDEVTVSGGAGLGAAMAASHTVKLCFARQWLRFTIGRRETTEDTQVLDAMVADLEGGTMLRLLKRYALTPQFRLRKASSSFAR